MFKKAVLIAVLLAAFGFGTAFADQIDSLVSLTGPAVAPFNVFVNPGGLGDVLLYGYYNVRDNNNTFFALTNTDPDFGARVRIRFREAATLDAPVCNGSQEVLDFDICLTPNDVWSGQITTDAGTGAAILISADDDTFIAPANKVFTDLPSDFGLFAFGSSNLGITADQTREGYFEVIAEQQTFDNCHEHPTNPNCVACGGTGEPACTCGNMLDTDLGSVGTGSDVGNVLMGQCFIVNLDTTSTFSYAATALADFSLIDITAGVTTARPNLRDDSETADINPVDFALTKDKVMSVYDLQSDIAGRTELIVTFPTKHLSHTEDVVSGNCVTSINGGSDTADLFDDPKVAVTVYDDAENSVTSSCQKSPCTLPTVSLPNEVNVVKINNSDIFTSDVETALSTGFSFGWIKIDLVDAKDVDTTVPHLVCSDSVNYPTCLAQTKDGLPAIGYAVLDFGGGTVSGLLPLAYTNSVR